MFSVCVKRASFSAHRAALCAAFGTALAAALGGCVIVPSEPPTADGARVYDTLTAELALARHDLRTAALQYTAAATSGDADPGLYERASEVTLGALQPTLALQVAGQWIKHYPRSLEAHHAAARAALERHDIERAASEYATVLGLSPRGIDAEAGEIAAELESADDVFGARQVAEGLAADFPSSQSVLTLAGQAALRADDPAAAARELAHALALTNESDRAAAPSAGEGAGGANESGGASGGASGEASGGAGVATGDAGAAKSPGGNGASRAGESAAAGASVASGPGVPADAGAAAGPGAGGESAPSDEARLAARREILQSLWRARILAGEAAVPLSEAHEIAEREPTVANRLDYALLLIAARRNDAATEELAALARDPSAGPVALRLLGLLAYDAGDLDRAQTYFTQLLTLGKSVDDAFYYLGMIAERSGDAERALRLYAQVQSGEDAVAALLRAGGILQAHGETAEADELLRHLLEDEPQRVPQILTARARLYAQAGNPEEAIGVLDRATAEYPDNVDLRYALATTYEEAGHLAEALRELKAILAERPNDPGAQNAYGYTLADHRKSLKRARTLIEQAHASAPKNAAILDSLGWVLYRQGDAQGAVGYLSEAFTDDRGADIGAHLGEVLWVLGRHEEADQVWVRASQADPDSKLLRETRRRLHAGA